MKKQQLIDIHNWHKTRLTLAILAALPGAAVAAGPPTNPVGPEFQVNTTTAGGQRSPAVAMDAAGDFVVAWYGNGQDDSAGIHAQRYNAAGEAQGAEFRVNTTTVNTQSSPAVAMDAAGDFVVVWASNLQDTSGYGIYAQRYNAAGVAQDVEFRVNTTTFNNQHSPAVAMDAAGDFVVAWESAGQDAPPSLDRGIYAQRYNAVGEVQGGEFRVNTTTADHQFSPAVAMDAAGDFVVTWTSRYQDTPTSFGIYAKRYNINAAGGGVTPGTEFRVNTTTASDQHYSAVAMNAAGNFVVTWQSTLQDGSLRGIYAKRYNINAAGGVTPGTEFRVNTTTANDQTASAVAMDAAGDFVVTWQSRGQDDPASSTGNGIYAQRYNAAGVAQESEFRVNTTTLNDQTVPAVAADAAGGFVVTWQSAGQDGNGDGIYAQGYAVNNYNAAFNAPTLSGQSYNPTAVPEGPAGMFSFTAHFCNNNNSAYPLSGLVSWTTTLTNNNCLLNRLYGPAGTPAGTLLPCGGGSVLDFPVTGGYSDYSLAVGECVDVTYQIGLQQRQRFFFYVDVGGM